MKTTNRYFDIYPRVAAAGQRTTIVVRPRFSHVGLDPDKTYEARCLPAEYYPADSHGGTPEPVRVTPGDGQLEISHAFQGEQEHLLEIVDPSRSDSTPLLRIRLYSVDGDLYGCLPLKGDLHIHSDHSDGKESPGFVAASCRRIGLDFMALTDHGKYAPSVQAQEAFAGLEHDLLICRGEEIHPPDNPVHMVNFGGSFSVNERIAVDPAAYRSAVRDRAGQFAEIPDAAVRDQLASCCWVFDQIRSGGGLGIFCHPYWHVSWGYTPAAPVTNALFASRPWDAYEVVGGYGRDAVDSNTLQIARYHEERMRGGRLPIVGVSDAHGCENSDLFGWYFTLVFADAPTQEAVIGAIKDCRSVAVEAIPGEAVRVYGPLRLVQYALFLLGEVIPAHDEICQQDGLLMLEFLGGRQEASRELAIRRGRTAAFWSRYAGCRSGAGHTDCGHRLAGDRGSDSGTST